MFSTLKFEILIVQNQRKIVLLSVHKSWFFQINFYQKEKLLFYLFIWLAKKGQLKGLYRDGKKSCSINLYS